MGRVKLVLGWLMVLVLMPMTGYASGDYIGEKECYSCHKDIKKIYLKDMHGKIFTKNPGNSLEEKSCEACHGPGSAHKVAADKADQGENVPMDVEYPFRKGDEFNRRNNERCLTCHEKGERTHWQGSDHEMSDVGCVDCHTIHPKEDFNINDACGKCHIRQRAMAQRASHLPVREGEVSCTSCHNPHGSLGPASLKQASVNENCYSCHAEKRGPLIWEHAPVRENCSNCHNPHGSNYEPLLKMKIPYLCKTCHMDAFHPSALYDGSDIASSAGGSSDRHTLGKGCLNCHPMIHGSNHPSGARLNR